jgi:hypothetical protein
LTNFSDLILFNSAIKDTDLYLTVKAMSITKTTAKISYPLLHNTDLTYQKNRTYINTKKRLSTGLMDSNLANLFFILIYPLTSKAAKYV